MKIKQEHYDHMKQEMDKVFAISPELAKNYEDGDFPNSDRTKDLQMRFCFDVMHMAGLTSYICKNVYDYGNDTHIFTALKRICPKVERKF
jgi:hypothetical protein